jgi:type I restriction enzyme R subunit
MVEFSENTRVKIPALVHATRLGYKYLSLKEYKNEIDEKRNIFKNIFKESINRINNLELSDDNITKYDYSKLTKDI